MLSFHAIWHVAEALHKVREGGEDGLEEAAQGLLERANLHVPRLTGHLQDTGRAEADGEEAAVSYDTVYAARLHEHPEYNFRGQGRGKWLQLAAEEEPRPILEDIADGLRKKLTITR